MTPTAPGRAAGFLTALLPGARAAEGDERQDGGRNPLAGVPRRALLVGGIAVLLLVALAVIIPLAGRDDEPGGDAGSPAGQQTSAPASQPAVGVPSPAAAPSSAAPSGSPSATPSGRPDPVIPPGWELYKDSRTGFSVPKPKGWRTSRDGSIVYFREPNGSRWFLIDQTDTPLPDPVADWKSKEAYRRSVSANYERVGQIRAVDYFLTAADWEWRYDSNGRRHTRNRGFVTAKDKAYAIRWDTPAAEWDENLVNFQIIADGFRPVRG